MARRGGVALLDKETAKTLDYDLHPQQAGQPRSSRFPHRGGQRRPDEPRDGPRAPARRPPPASTPRRPPAAFCPPPARFCGGPCGYVHQKDPEPNTNPLLTPSSPPTEPNR
eukprot:1191374-Prorocentrum_minimum.AAC.5